MPSFTLKEGEFGSEGTCTFDSSELYLPDPAQPGALVSVALTDIVEVESLRQDNTQRLQAAAKLSAKGFLTAGPVGLAAGMLAARHVPDTEFRVRLSDGRSFVATANAAIYAEFHAAQLAVATDGSHTAADAIIEKYLQAKNAEENAAADEEGGSAAPPEIVVPEAPAGAKPARPVFGRRTTKP